MALVFLRDVDSRTETHRESLVASFGAFVALVDVSRKTAGEDQHLAPAARNVRAPDKVGAWKRVVWASPSTCAPSLIGGDHCLNPGEIELAKIIEQSRDPVSLQRRASRSVAEGVRTCGP
jgi:hypothetical protein